jgi:hypothetical protein
MVTRIRVLVLVVLAACGFDRHQLDRSCNADTDCQPEESCQSGSCIQRSCSTATDCGTQFAFSCIAGGCVAGTCTASADCSLGFTCGATGYCEAFFNVTGAASTGNNSMTVTFDAPPEPATATALGSYAVDGLSLTGTPTLAGNTVTLQTSTQAAATYTVTVNGVVRASDHATLTTATATFTGRIDFDVTNASATTSRSVAVTFDAAPDAAAMALGNYAIPGLSLTGSPTVVGNTVTLTTSAQSAISYTVTVTGVARASDGEPLTTSSAMFTGRAPFDVTSASATTSHSVDVVFDAAPNVSQATTVASYSIPGLTVIAATLSGNVATLTTSTQSATSFTVTVSGVTRASDGEALTAATAGFTGRPPFDVASASATSSTSVAVTFDAVPNAAQATTPANYAIAGLTVSAATLAGNTVTLTTSSQSASSFTVTVANVTRVSDAESLTVASAGFMGRTSFNVVSAASVSNTSITVTFSSPPTAAQATTITNYSIPGLTVSGTPSLSGNTVTITTAAQSVTSYTVTVSNVTRATDAEALSVNAASFTGKTGFNVTGAASVGSTTMSVMYDAAPNAAQATTLTNYSVPGLTLSGTPTLSGNTVTITTTAQAAMTYTVTVSNVTRASDAAPLSINMASFTHTSFNVASAQALTSHAITVTYDAPPTSAQATTLTNYNVPGLTLLGTPTLAGNTVTIATSTQAAMTYTVTVANVTRVSDGTALTVNTANFTGIAPFNVASASAPSSASVAVTFSAAPNAAQATTLTNYAIPGLTLTGTPTLSGNVVTIATSVQTVTSYTVTVSNVTRASDGEPLTTKVATFTGKAQAVPTVTNVVVQSTNPNNGATFYNTGTATVVITGTSFTGINCISSVSVDDVDGNGVPLGTGPSACTVDSDTQITATFPYGIQSSYIGYNVQVTNTAGTNATSAVKLVVKAGLLISEIYVASSGGGGTPHQFLEIYNPTSLAIDLNNVGVYVHVRNAAGTDTNVTVTFLGGGSHQVVASHGFWLMRSLGSVSTDSWYAHADATFDQSVAGLVSNGGVYLSVDPAAAVQVVDKVGWGSQPTNGYEGTATANIPVLDSIQRKPAGGNGAATDTDNNNNDFLAPSATITPNGTIDPTQP